MIALHPVLHPGDIAPVDLAQRPGPVVIAPLLGDARAVFVADPGLHRPVENPARPRRRERGAEDALGDALVVPARVEPALLEGPRGVAVIVKLIIPLQGHRRALPALGDPPGLAGLRGVAHGAGVAAAAIGQRAHRPDIGFGLVALPGLIQGRQFQGFALQRFLIDARIEAVTADPVRRGGIAHFPLLGAGETAEFLLPGVVIAIVILEAGGVGLRAVVHIQPPQHSQGERHGVRPVLARRAVAAQVGDMRVVEQADGAADAVGDAGQQIGTAVALVSLVDQAVAVVVLLVSKLTARVAEQPDIAETGR